MLVRNTSLIARFWPFLVLPTRVGTDTTTWAKLTWTRS